MGVALLRLAELATVGSGGQVEACWQTRGTPAVMPQHTIGGASGGGGGGGDGRGGRGRGGARKPLPQWQWQWLSERGWVNQSPQVNSGLEHSYLNKEPDFTFSIPNAKVTSSVPGAGGRPTWYVVNFLDFTQRPKQNPRKARRVQRVPIGHQSQTHAPRGAGSDQSGRGGGGGGGGSGGAPSAQQPPSAAAPSTAAAPIRWQWESSQGYVDQHPSVSAAIEAAYRARLPQVDVNIAGKAYTVGPFFLPLCVVVPVRHSMPMQIGWGRSIA